MTALYVLLDGCYKAATDRMVCEAARKAIQRAFTRGPLLDSPAAAIKYLVPLIGALEHEVFCCGFLDNRHHLIKFVELFRGTVDGASVHPREVVKAALECNASAVVLAHNHPSGNSAPSQADELITRRLREALALIDIRVLDHFIVGGDGVLSFAERGLL